MHDHRDVAMLGIVNVFLYAENYEYILILICVKLSELLVKVDPRLYRKYVITSKKVVTMLYVKLTNALYRILRIAMLFFSNLITYLEEICFGINPYDPCGANITINSSHMNVCWHFHDLKV